MKRRILLLTSLLALVATAFAQTATLPTDDPRFDQPVALSTDGGRRFGDPVVVAEKTPTGRVDVALLGDGRAAVSWLGRADTTAALHVRAVDDRGVTGTPALMARLPSASRGVGMPRLVRSDGHLYAAWTSPCPLSTLLFRST